MGVGSDPMSVHHPQAKHTYAEVEQFRRRALLSLFVVVVCLFGLVGWYFKLQVLDHRDLCDSF